MAESYKRLGAVAPSDDKEKLLYTSPAATSALVSNITVTNRSASPQTFDINVYESGVTQQSDLDDTGLPPTFVAVARQFPGNTAAYSTDGISWTSATLPSTGTWYSVAYGNEKFIALSPDFNSNSYFSATSTDGISWTSATLPAGLWLRVSYTNGLFFLVSDGNSVALSTDAITWTTSTLPSFRKWLGVLYANGIYVTVSETDSGLLTTAAASSTDGITWTARTMPVPFNWNAISYGSGVIVAVGEDNYYGSANTTAASSTDGITWTLRTVPNGNNSKDLAYGNGTFVAAGYFYFGNAVATSTDGISWTARALPNMASGQSVTYGNGVFVVSSATAAATSTDGITWTSGTMPQNVSWFDLAYGEDIQEYISPTQTTLYKSSDIAANSTEVLEPGIALGPEGAVVVKDNSGGSLTFSTYGVELS